MSVPEPVRELLEREAKERERIHANHASSRPLTTDYEMVGLAGELAFGRFSGLMPDLDRKPGGDKGVDFVVTLRFSVDVKTSKNPGHLVHDVGKPFADIFVLAGFDETTREAELIGWTWGATLKAQQPSTLPGSKDPVHMIRRNNLRRMAELGRMLARIK